MTLGDSLRNRGLILREICNILRAMGRGLLGVLCFLRALHDPAASSFFYLCSPVYTVVVLKRGADSPLVAAAKQWVLEKYPYNSYHLLNSLEWLDRIAPESPEAVRLATLTHDMERAFPGPDQPIPKSLVDPEYHAVHSARSARIVGEWLLAQGAGDPLTGHVEALIRVHEDGGWTEANLVQAADSLSFLDCNIDLFLGKVREEKWTAADVRIKFDYSYHRIQVPGAKELARPMLDRANARLSALESELSERRTTTHG
jgi:hypothetical protein